MDLTPLLSKHAKETLPSAVQPSFMAFIHPSSLNATQTLRSILPSCCCATQVRELKCSTFNGKERLSLLLFKPSFFSMHPA